MAYEINHNDYCMYRDMYKDAYGFRPRTTLVCASQAEFDDVIARLDQHIQYDIAQQKSWEAIAYDAWIAKVHKMARDTGNPIINVVRWLFEAENLDIKDQHDREYFCYLNQFASHFKLIEKIK